MFAMLHPGEIHGYIIGINSIKCLSDVMTVFIKKSNNNNEASNLSP